MTPGSALKTCGITAVLQQQGRQQAGRAWSWGMEDNHQQAEF